MGEPLEPGVALVIGLGVTGEAVARRLAERGWDVTVAEDRPSDAARARAVALAERGVRFVESPTPEALDALVDGAGLVLPSPGVPRAHPATERAIASGRPVWSELELVARWSTLPAVAVTGTNGKTTVVTLVEAMLSAGGMRTVAAGNTDVPLVDVLDRDLDVVVVEASSFRLDLTETWRPHVGTWLNLAEDHLDWHRTMDAYAAAKARIWACQTADDVAVANAGDPVVMAHAGRVASGVTTFGAGGAWRVEGDRLLLPDGSTLLEVGDLPRSFPHDVDNALAASATAIAAGASLDAVRSVLRTRGGLPHRIALVGEHGGVRFFDDSKATDPHATLAALRGFPSVVLVAGGRNKGLDLSVLADEADRLRAVVAIGESGDEVAAVFDDKVPVGTAATMDEAVAAARAAARPGDVVLLSPGCASFDWYGSYAERGVDFARAVRESIGRAS